MYSQVESQIQFFTLCVYFVHSLLPFFMYFALYSCPSFLCFAYSFFSFCLLSRSFSFCSVSLPSLFPCFYVSFIFRSYLLSSFHPTCIALCSRITNHTLCTLCPPSGLVPEQTCQVEKAGPVAAVAGCLEDEMSGTGCFAVAAR